MKELEDLGFKLDTAYTKPTYIKFYIGNNIFMDKSTFIKIVKLKSNYKLELIKIRNPHSSPRQDILKSIRTTELIHNIKFLERMVNNERID